MDLAQLIAATKGDRTYAELADRAGGDPGRQRWHQLATKPIKNFPDPPTILGLSRALSISPHAVIRACAESLGFDRPDEQPRLVTLLPPAVDFLSDRQVDLVRALVVEFLESYEQTVELDRAQATAKVTPLSPVATPTPKKLPAAARTGPNEGRSRRAKQDEDAEGPQQ